MKSITQLTFLILGPLSLPFVKVSELMKLTYRYPKEEDPAMVSISVTF